MAAKINPQLIFVQGRSLGGAVAFYMVHQNQGMFRGMIIENTFTSISEIADQLYPFVKPVKDYLLRNFWHSDKLAPEIRVPVQYVTGDKDEIIPTVMTH